VSFCAKTGDNSNAKVARRAKVGKRNVSIVAMQRMCRRVNNPERGVMLTLAVIVRLRWFNDLALGSRNVLAANNGGVSAAISYGPPVDDLLRKIRM